MDKRFFNMFGLTEDQAIALLQTPLEQLNAPTERYVAAAHLINFPTERSINALIAAIENPSHDLYDRITRRKALESLGRLQAAKALPIIRDCLTDEDIYTVENAVWAIGEIGTQETAILEKISQLLDKPGQSYRTIIQTLAKLDYQPAVSSIEKLTNWPDKPIASAAIAAICRLTGDYRQMGQVVAFLQDDNVNARRGSIQDLIDAGYYQAIPQISRCPVSIAFRLRGIRLLAEVGKEKGLTFAEVEPYLDSVIYDHPEGLDLVHEYDQPPTIDFTIGELYHTDFGRCYLASKTLLENYATAAPEALLTTWKKEAHNDYGAHYHVIKILGWLQYSPAYDLFIEALENTSPQFQKSRAAAAIALGNLGDRHSISLLHKCLNSQIFDLKYAGLLALEKLGDQEGKKMIAEDEDWLILSKANRI
ncbi:phycocyanobilin lyase subunit alpha [Microcystis aeruginosa NIES-2520]|jgi:bilin biosynthesis protein|uniref:Phycocyanobilin lyase subunit alpha n=1 Tax=Microcystis aeruginosa NIES-2520 TaxID=2303982 RepID=A0A5A5RLE9_MICAE|nr:MULTISPECIES: HEAT repeat domain-containing protein [Microcystis]NCR77352.1 HEAT repeat domain-containing protein [Microcystis aeruginosa K13-06]MCA2666837.1 HEAT repeat domain-containing protein [Microcystis sp. M045S2]MCA2714161.1 HEAT repeat domain-containing protein [Microcystis sp. M172S2]MCA2802892.1 HEAT repeat domain-containing protein [Microcystis sp. M114S2]MCA2835827.1 HEAT repeat domain-containing protein [Microcystis sp. M007S1]